jgi:glycosyltransferase involved in cell wall biosynthesis
MNKKTLIVTPDLTLLGGVANHYLGLKKYWTHEVEYITYGRRKFIPALIMLPIDFLRYLLKLVIDRPDIIIINPSLRYYQLIRDGLYLISAKLFKIEVITFIHGWDEKVVLKLLEKPFLFKNTYGKSKFIYVLAEKFRIRLVELNLNCPVLLTTTKVDDKLLTNFEINTRAGVIRNILFLARVELNKGIFISIDVFEEILKTHNYLTLTIVGSGGALERAKLYVLKKNIKNVFFKGALSGKALIQEYHKGNLYILPTTHGEGMPTSVLEAMAFGLPIITRPVGGLNDFFEEGKMGTLIESCNPFHYVSAIKNLIEHENKCKEIGVYNHRYAIENFLASKVARKIEADIY